MYKRQPSSRAKNTGIRMMVMGVAYRTELAKKMTTLIRASRTTVMMSLTCLLYTSRCV